MDDCTLLEAFDWEELEKVEEAHLCKEATATRDSALRSGLRLARPNWSQSELLELQRAVWHLFWLEILLDFFSPRLLAAERKLAGVGIRSAKDLGAALEEAAAS
ncbi:erkA [Symbiodinium sp. KB8]|nr:erkA [Symbiodinium sp. KB8]